MQEQFLELPILPLLLPCFWYLLLSFVKPVASSFDSTLWNCDCNCWFQNGESVFEILVLVLANILFRGFNCCIASFFVVLLRDVFNLWHEMGLFRPGKSDVSDVSVSLSFRERFFVLGVSVSQTGEDLRSEETETSFYIRNAWSRERLGLLLRFLIENNFGSRTDLGKLLERPVHIVLSNLGRWLGSTSLSLNGMFALSQSSVLGAGVCWRVSGQESTASSCLMVVN